MTGAWYGRASFTPQELQRSTEAPPAILRVAARAEVRAVLIDEVHRCRDSAAIAASLARHGHPFAVPTTSRRFRRLDTVLLRVLDRDPDQLETAFARLFAASPADRVLRFLDEQSSLRDDLRIVASLPPAPYLRALAGNPLGTP
ncbi:lycopene cyclase family protein [Dactylosporangium sp. NPDC049140]|uniref:lycopene cyclase family protein n=1 Tax=Dactylosporangium sp. NPDC049140 TaxID=3155647 RepID=UPI0033F18AF1